MVLEDDRPVLRLNHEANVEEASRELGMSRLGLRHHVGPPPAGQSTELVGLPAGGVDGAFPRVPLVVQVEDLIGEPLQSALRDADQLHRKVHAGQPGRCLDHVRDVLEIPADLLTAADAPHRLDETYGLVWLDHLDRSPLSGGESLSVAPGGRYWRYRSTVSASRTCASSGLAPASRNARRWRNRSQQRSSSTLTASRRCWSDASDSGFWLSDSSRPRS